MSAHTISTVEDGTNTPKRILRSQQSGHMNNFLVGGLRPGPGVAYSQIKRGRQVNEDSYLLESRELVSGSRISLIGVFDGHGNEQLSHWLSVGFADVFFKIFTIFQQAYGLPECLDYIRKLFPSDDSFRVRSKRLAALNCPDVVTLSLCASFAVCEEQAMSLANVDTAHGGACATVVAVTYAGVFIAKVGDSSAAILSTSGSSSIVLKTSDHRPICRPDEVSRVVALGGSVYKGNAVGMAFSSLNVTRSLGDTLWRANDDWRRDKTCEPTSNQLAIDESLSLFSRTKGCVGVTSDPEWYSCCCQGGSSGGEGVVHWAVSTNAPLESTGKRLFKSGGDSEVRFYLVVGSDGFWETPAVGSLVQRAAAEGDPPSASELVDIAAGFIGGAPHDDSTVVVTELSIDMDHLVGRRKTVVGGGTSTDGESVRTTRRQRRSMSDHDKGGGGGHLDYLFA